eukprot:1144445-Pelagomonas_calceolata.AAC.2
MMAKASAKIEQCYVTGNKAHSGTLVQNDCAYGDTDAQCCDLCVLFMFSSSDWFSYRHRSLQLSCPRWQKQTLVLKTHQHSSRKAPIVSNNTWKYKYTSGWLRWRLTSIRQGTNQQCALALVRARASPHPFLESHNLALVCMGTKARPHSELYHGEARHASLIHTPCFQDALFPAHHASLTGIMVSGHDGLGTPCLAHTAVQIFAPPGKVTHTVAQKIYTGPLQVIRRLQQSVTRRHADA